MIYLEWMAGAAGLNLRMAVPRAAALPLGYAPIQDPNSQIDPEPQGQHGRKQTGSVFVADQALHKVRERRRITRVWGVKCPATRIHRHRTAI